MYTYLAAAAVAFATGFGAAWYVQGNTITTIKSEAKDAIITQQRTARQTYERYSAALSKAQEDAQIRRSAINTAIDSNASGLIGLRITTAAALRTSTATSEACTAYADTVTELFGECGEALIRVAGQADGHVSDIQTLMAAP